MRTSHVKAKKGFSRAVRGIAMAATALTFMSTAAHADYEIGLEAYSQGQYDVALDLWERYAIAGDVRSMKALGDFYSNVSLVDNETGEIAEEERTPPNYIQSLKWYTLAAYHDFDQQLRTPTFVERNAQIDAHERLPQIRAMMTTASVRKSEKLVSATYERGSPRDIYTAAELYRRGAGLAKSNLSAYRLYLVAADRGVREAAASAREMREKNLVNKKEIEAAQEQAAAWQPPLPEEHRGNTLQMAELERLKNELEELRLQDALEAVSDIDVELIQQALRSLGFYYGTIDNAMGPQTRDAIRKFQFSRVQNDAEMTPEEKRNAEIGVLSARDTVSLFEQAATRADHPMSQYVYGVMHTRGIGVAQDGEVAVKWLEAAADDNLALAHYALGVIFRDGTTGLNSVNPEKSRAALHFAKAKALGYTPAGRALELLEFERPGKVE